ncbi:MAG: hypothetical protein IAC08_00500 [Bacteroidetes bacterium]|uniref:Glycoside hydrolase family 5 domain-containing protein n=1 Tax=Candidatus Cryptobacteroides intestinigallinarum TaxID=2840767 RepID=A0A9D9HJA6_9BACT|nr:hypothetical protein [Candidatus Cryptobacteroides intestinigallinarum]
MTKKTILSATLALALISCTGNRFHYSDKIPDTVIRIDTDSISNTGYIGNGAQWDPYSLDYGSGHIDISQTDWEKIYSRLDYMKPQYVRCMINSPFTYFNAETGKYERDRNKEYITRLLSYCQENGIMVIYGEYNPPTWDMKDSQEWVEMSVNYLIHLVTTWDSAA